MAVLTAITTEDARNLVRQYDLGELGGVIGIPAGSVNSNFRLELGGRPVFLRIYEEQGLGGAEHETAMLERLARKRVPTPAPYRRKDGRLVSVVGGKPAALFPWQEGTIRCQARVDPESAEKLGRALAQVHVAGSTEPCEEGRFGFVPLGARLESIAASGDARFVGLAPTLRDALSRLHKKRDRTLPSGLIHSDLFRDNVLWDDHGDIAALLDFESACAGTYAYDVMVCVLSWCFATDFEPEIARAMMRGYEGVRPLEEKERTALEVEGRFAALRFTITRITDYALRAQVEGPRVVKDWRRFLARYEGLERLGEAGVRRLLGV
jgi:homoserine kinase type II